MVISQTIILFLLTFLHAVRYAIFCILFGHMPNDMREFSVSNIFTERFNPNRMKTKRINEKLIYSEKR
ncbi:MAG: hypothetical protein LBV69_01190 [Bacteroidales bacterium]|jgi:hypothetical protein|nr:hypothetical protein [Bacteroidales bacterium]